MRFASALFLAFFAASALAQGGEKLRGWSIETNFGGGQIIRHTPKITIGTDQFVPSQELAVDFQTFGKKDWQAWKKYPRFGFAAAHFGIGDAAHGRLTGLMPTLTTPLAERGKFGLGLRIGAGAGWIWRPFDYLKNPAQNAIGSHLNSLVQFRLAGRWELSKRSALLAGGSFTHASNGGSALPNFGVNVASFFVAGQFSSGFLTKNDFLQPELAKKIPSKRPHYRLGATVSTGFARQESTAFDGPKYPVLMASAAAAWSISRANRLLLGADWELHRSVQFFLAHSNGQDENVEKFRPQATRWAVTAGDEIWYGPVAVQLSAGVYVSPKSELTTFFVYTKLGARWHFPTAGRAKPFVGVTMKSHKIIAEYIAATTGVAF